MFYTEDHHDVTTALCTVLTPSTPTVQTHVATSDDLPLLFPVRSKNPNAPFPQYL